MIFEWIEAKNAANKIKHGLGFEVVYDFDWPNALIDPDSRKPYGEERWSALGLVGDRVHQIVFTKRGMVVRIISLRKAMPAKGGVMSRKRKPSHISQKDWDSVDSPPMSAAALKRMRPISEVFPDLARVGRRRARRGEPVKQPVNMRLSPKVIAFFKSKGPGWQTRIDRALVAFVEASE